MVERRSKVREPKDVKQGHSGYFDIWKSCAEIEDTFNEIRDLFFARLIENPKEMIYRKILFVGHFPKVPYKNKFTKIADIKVSILSKIDQLSDRDKEKLLKFATSKKRAMQLNRPRMGKLDRNGRQLMSVYGDLFRIYEAIEKKLLA